jgi:hypothetical protein
VEKEAREQHKRIILTQATVLDFSLFEPWPGGASSTESSENICSRGGSDDRKTAPDFDYV